MHCGGFIKYYMKRIIMIVLFCLQNQNRSIAVYCVCTPNLYAICQIVPCNPSPIVVCVWPSLHICFHHLQAPSQISKICTSNEENKLLGTKGKFILVFFHITTTLFFYIYKKRKPLHGFYKKKKYHYTVIGGI